MDQQRAEALVAQSREQGMELLGDDRLLRQMNRAVLERALAEELDPTEHWPGKMWTTIVPCGGTSSSSGAARTKGPRG
jgi:putative transposase